MLYPVDICHTMRQLLESRVRNYPDAPLFIYKDKTRTQQTCVNSADFAAQTRSLGAWLMGKGLHGERIAILGENSYYWLLCFFGVVCSGNVAALLDRNLSVRVLRQLMDDTGCRVLFYSEAQRDTAERLIDGLDISAYCLDHIPAHLDLDAGLSESFESAYDALTVQPEELAVISFTSGTSGKNKGVMLSQENVAIDTCLGCRCNDFSGRSLLLLPLHHMFGLTAGVLGIFHWGGSIYINQGLRYIPGDIAEVKPNVVTTVPAMLPFLYRGFSAIKPVENVKLMCGGAPADSAWIERFRALGAVMDVGYGMTECSPVIAVSSELWDRHDGAMRVIDGVQLRIDAPDKNGCGEILVSGPNVMQGYYGLPEETEKTLRDGWLYTGDIGRLDSEGYLTITGRKKNLLILSNGENVSAEAMERLLMRIDGVKECLTSVVDGVIQAEIYSDGREDETRKAILEWNHTLDPARRIIKIVFRNTEFPKNSSQKIIRHPQEQTAEAGK